MSKLIFLDAGHGGLDPGAVGATGLKEANVNLKVTKLLDKYLKNAGFRTKNTRISKAGYSLKARTNLANKVKADLLISIHCNSYVSKTANGTETFAYSLQGESYKVAKIVQSGLIKATGLTDRGVKIANFHMLRESNMPAILIEMAFISNKDEEQLLADNAFLEKVAKSITDSITSYYKSR